MTFFEPPLAITGCGVASSLGGVISSCAAARSGMSRATALPYGIEDQASLEMVPVTGHPVGALTTGFSEVGLMVRLASLALADFCQRAPFSARQLESMAILINLPSSFYLSCAQEARARANARQPSAEPSELAEGGEVSDTERFEACKPLYHSVIDKSFRSLGLRSPPRERQHVYFSDQAGIGQLLSAAHRLLASKAVSCCLIGGVDSLIESRWLRACDDLGILKTPLRPIGLLPGEAAAFLLVEAVRTSDPAQTSLGVVPACASGREDRHRFSDPRPVGKVLSDVMESCLSTASRRRGLGVICDLNGDPARAVEFSCAMSRLQPEVLPLETLVPAIAFGDTRAASAFMGSCVALHAFARRSARSDRFVLCASGDDGARTAVLIDAPT